MKKVGKLPETGYNKAVYYTAVYHRKEDVWVNR